LAAAAPADPILEFLLGQQAQQIQAAGLEAAEKTKARLEFLAVLGL